MNTLHASPAQQVAAYQFTPASELITPCLLVYPQIIERNVQEAIRIAGSPQRLRPHVKTHKTAEIVQLARRQGIDKHKCATLKEAALLAECGVADVLIAYPQVGPAVLKLISLTARFPGTRFSTVVDSTRAATELNQLLAERQLQIDVLIDIDSGMHRTGIAPGSAAAELALHIASAPALTFGGLHIYDGQNHQPELSERQQAVQQLMEPVLNLVRRLQSSGLAVPKLVCGGTPTFPVFAEYQVPVDDVELELSPGTCVLSDYNYGKDYRDMSGFQHAALLLTRVISKTGGQRLTVDLGYKAVASDPPAERRCFFPELPDARLVQHSEEHLMLETSRADAYATGDLLFAVPAHICPTVALHAQLQVIENGRLAGCWPVAARDRFYRV